MQTDKILNYLFIGYAVSIPLSPAGIAFFSILIILFWLFTKNKVDDMKKVYQNSVVKALLFFWIFNIISILWVDTHNLLEAIEDIFKYWYFIPIIVISMYIKKDNVLKIISAFILGVFISELVSYGIFFELVSTKHGTPSDPTPFMNHLDYAIFLSFTSLLLLTRIIYEKNLKYRYLYILFFLSVTTNLFIIGGRIGYVIFIITIFILFIHIFEHKLKAFLKALLLVSTVIILAYNFSGIFKNRLDSTIVNSQKVIENKNYCNSLGARVGFMIITKDILISDPLMGVGLGEHLYVLDNIVDRDYPDMQCIKKYTHYHNQYLEVLSQTGIIGLILFLLIFYYLFKRKYKSKEFELINIIFISVYLIGFVADPFFIKKQFTMAMFVLFFSLLNAQYMIENGKRDN